MNCALGTMKSEDVVFYEFGSNVDVMMTFLWIISHKCTT